MTEWRFSRDAIRRFRFVRCGFDAGTGVAELVYAFDEGPELAERPGVVAQLQPRNLQQRRPQLAQSLVQRRVLHGRATERIERVRPRDRRKVPVLAARRRAGVASGTRPQAPDQA